MLLRRAAPASPAHASPAAAAAVPPRLATWAIRRTAAAAGAVPLLPPPPSPPSLVPSARAAAASVSRIRPQGTGRSSSSSSSRTALRRRRPGATPPPAPAAAATAATTAAWPAPSSGNANANNATATPKKKDKLPMQQRVLNALLNVSNVPYSSYVPTPETPLHRIDAAVKQLWLLALYVAVARSPPPVRVGLAAGVALLTVATQPPRLWRPQLLRLSAICAFIFVGAALGADGVPPLLQPRAPPAELDGLVAVAAAGSTAPAASASLAAESPYSYVLWNAGIFTVTRRSVNLALTAASLTFCALQGASLCLVTTPGEEMALALRRFLWPLRLLGVQTRRVALTLLLSLRFMSLVFEEVRNLCLGLAARGIAWREQGARGSIEIAAQMTARLFANLFERSEKIAQAMAVRGFLGPEMHETYCMKANRTSVVANVVALALLGVLLWGAFLG